MPCYETRTISVFFKIGNIDLLKKAIENQKMKLWSNSRNDVVEFIDNQGRTATINLNNSSISSRYLNEKEITNLSNQIKRSYSEVVISEVSQKQRWIQKKLSDRKFQLVKH